MKTTVNIPDSLFKEIKKITMNGMSLRLIIETALRNYLKNNKSNNINTFKLKDGSFGGDGLCDDIQEVNWSEIRSRTYKGRGE